MNTLLRVSGFGKHKTPLPQAADGGGGKGWQRGSWIKGPGAHLPGACPPGTLSAGL
jgi:hypothetical protein